MLTDSQIDELLKELQEANEMPDNIAQDIVSDNAWHMGAEIEDVEEVSVKEYGPNIRAMLRGQAAQATQERKRIKRAEEKAKEKKIIEDAINDGTIDLRAPLDTYFKKIIVKQRTAKYFDKAKYLAGRIETAASGALRRVSPRDLLSAYNKYKDSFIPALPFTWVTFDNKYEYKVNLENMPYFYKPEDCQNIINETNSDEAGRIDLNIHHFYKYNDAGSKLEISVAQQVASYKTFLELLKKKPTWFNDLVIYIKESNGISA